jgi:hypothetical protein
MCAVSISEKDVVPVTIAHAEDEEVILMAPGVPPVRNETTFKPVNKPDQFNFVLLLNLQEEINDAVKSLFPTLPGTVKGFRQIKENRTLGPFIPLTLAVRTRRLIAHLSPHTHT